MKCRVEANNNRLAVVCTKQIVNRYSKRSASINEGNFDLKVTQFLKQPFERSREALLLYKLSILDCVRSIRSHF